MTEFELFRVLQLLTNLELAELMERERHGKQPTHTPKDLTEPVRTVGL